MSQTRTVFKNTMWSGVDLVVDVVLPPLMSILVARALGPTKLGAYTYIMWISSMATLLGCRGIPLAIFKYMADYAGQRRPGAVAAIFRVGLIYQSAIALVLVGAGLCWAAFFSLPDHRLFVMLAVLAIFPAALMGIATSAHATMEELGPNVIASAVGGAVNAIGTILALVMHWDLVGLAAALLVGRLADAGLRWILAIRRFPRFLVALRSSEGPVDERPALPPGLGRQMTIFCAQSTALLVLTLIVWNRSEMFFLKQFCSLNQVAYYSVAFGLSMVPAQLAGPFTKAAGVSLYAEQGRGDERGQRFTRIFWRYLGFLVLPASFGLAVMSGPLVRVLYGARYHDAIPALAVAAAFGIFGPLGRPAAELATAAGEQGLLVRSGLVAAVITLLLDWWLVSSYAALGGALANGLGQAVSTIAIWIAVHKRLGPQVPGRFALRLIGVTLGMAAAVALVAALLPDLVTVVVGPLVGVAAYALLVKFACLLEPEDVDRLVAVANLFPQRARPLCRRFVHLVANQ
jgi:O-antigen/teichoic acid export membrane protein